MEFKLDENLPNALVDDLKNAGHHGATCQEEGIAGTGDAAIAAHAVSERRVLLTLDLDFSDIRQYPPGKHPGIIIFRLHSQDITTLQKGLGRLLQNVAEEDVIGNTVIVEVARVRIRRP
jgi:predicted nuclease of predicted toxin-antitoxin system